ncbi:MAG: glycosyltransferase [Phycisphaerales bacterium]|nr:glycosyltransferase [Phycisphaerales bacterium]
MDKHETLEWISRIPPCASELVGQDIVMLGHQRWDEHFTPVHGTTLRLAQRNRVLFVEPPDSFGWLVSYLSESDHRHSAARRALKHVRRRLERIDETFAIYHTPPVFLPMQARSRMVLRTMNWVYTRMVREGMRALGMREPIVWMFQFNTVGVARALRPKLTVYECAEESAEFVVGEKLKRYVRRMDAELCAFADVVVVPNPHMYEARKEVCRRIHMLPWAADVEHFNRAMDPKLEIPGDIAGIGRPIVGIYANIDVRRFDVGFLVELARRRPEWNLVMIGRVLPDFDDRPLREMPNIHLLGSRPLAELPAYVKAFDVCMIPYAVNAFTRSITPLKMAEYLATGRPVVTTALPAAQMYGDVLRVADDLNAFEGQIAEALREPPGLMEKRLAAAQAANWDNYMRRKTGFVAECLGTLKR